MLKALVNWSLHNRVAVVLLAVVLLAAGLLATVRARLDVFPEFAPPQVVVQTEAPGLAPEQVEQLITLPLENNLQGLPQLNVLRSQSIQGLSVVTLVFQDGTDIYRARQQVGERLAELAGQFPPEVRKPPRIAPLTSTTGRLLIVGFTSDKLSPMELRDRIQWTLRPQLLAVPGVAQVTIFGGEVRQFQVQLFLEQLQARNLTVGDVLDATRQASGISGAGFQQNTNQRTTLRVEGQATSAAELANTVLTTAEGTPLRLGDVASVVAGPEPKFGDAALNDERTGHNGLANMPSVELVVAKQLDEDTRSITERVEARLAELEPKLRQQGITYHPGLFRQADFIDLAVGNVDESLLLGTGLVCVVLFVFLFDFHSAGRDFRTALADRRWWAIPWRVFVVLARNLRVAFISLTAIPLSLLAAVLVLHLRGVGLNTLTLGGLVIAVGEVVDDAIIDVENIARRLRENARLGSPRAPLAVVLSASLEVRGAVVYATLIVVLVFVPVFLMTGLGGRLFAPLGYAYVLAVLASLGVALTVTPALSLMLLTRGQELSAEEPLLLRWLQAGFERLLRRLDREYVLVVAVTGLLIATVVVASVVTLTSPGGEFLPELRENHYVVHLTGLPGTSLDQSLAAGNRTTRLLRTEPGLREYVRSISQQAGRAELGEDTTGVEYSEVEIDLRPLGAEDAEQLQRRMARSLAMNNAGFRVEVLPFLTERVNETLSGTSAQVAVKVYGDRLEDVDQAAQRIARELSQIKGRDDKPAALNLHLEPQTGAPELVVRPRWEDASRFGVRNAQLLDAMHTAFQGAEISPVYDRNRVLDLAVVLEPEARNRPEAVGDLWLNLPVAAGARPPEAGEGRVQLKQVADVFLSDGRFLIAHEQGQRRQVVTCNVDGAVLDVGTFVDRAEQRLARLPLPAGVSYDATGEHRARRAAERELLLWSLAAAAGILVLLWLVFRSFRLLLLILIGMPFAVFGGAAAVYLGGGNLNVGTLVGFVTLIGITMRNGIMLVSHWQHLHDVEGMAWGPDLVFRGARERLAPVLMTALVTGLGLLPIALGSGEAGREIEGPMALVILGGLVTSTGLNLFVLPVIYCRLVISH